MGAIGTVQQNCAYRRCRNLLKLVVNIKVFYGNEYAYQVEHPIGTMRWF
jgi:hypothetical protein